MACPTLLDAFGLGAERQGFVVEGDFQLTFDFLVVEMEDCQHVFVVLSFSFQVGRYSPSVAKSLISTFPLPANLHQYA